MTRTPYGKLADGTQIDLFHLQSDQLDVKLMNYGATVVSIHAPDRHGKKQDVVLGFDSLAEYVADVTSGHTVFLGSTIGRYANRIGGGAFRLDGVRYELPKNDGPNTLHGGPHGFYSVMWGAREVENGVEFQYVSKDGEEGFPGELSVAVRFVVQGPELLIGYLATTTKPTVITMTNHSYFNLRGAEKGGVLDHTLKLEASRITPVNEKLIPTGELTTVAGTPFDFRKPTEIGERIGDANKQLQLGHGYDHNFVLDQSSEELRLAAELQESGSGRTLQVLTTEPAIQFYSGNFLTGQLKGKRGVRYEKHSGLCLEPQHYPDSPNQPQFPSTTLRPGETYKSATVFRFSAS